MKRVTALIISCVFAIAASSALMSQNAPDNQPSGKTAEPAKPAGEVSQPGTEANRTTPSTQPAGPEKAKSYSDGATTFVNAKAQFRLSTKDNFVAGKIMYKIDGGAEQAYDKEFAITAEGKHSISYYGVDSIQNKEDERIFHVTVDTTAPEVTVNPKFPFFTANGKLYVSSQYSFNVAAADALSGVNSIAYTINGKDYSSYATAFSLYNEGSIDFRVKAEDNVGNISSKFRIKKDDGAYEDKDFLTLMIDNTAPEVKIEKDASVTSVNGKDIAAKGSVFTVTAADKEAGVKQILIRIDGKGDFIQYDKGISFATNGDHYIEAKAVDGVGNVSNTAILPVYVDLVPPKSTIEISE